MTQEKVYAVWEYWDGIRAGFADFGGYPHHFKAEWAEEEDDYLATFTLTRITAETLELVREHSRIFHEWELAYHGGEACGPHPGKGDPRFIELQQAIAMKVAWGEVVARGMVGRFDSVAGQELLPRGVFREQVVTWNP